MQNKMVQNIAKALSAADPEDAFWAVVDQIGWGVKTIDIDYIKRAIMTVATPAQAKMLQHMLDEKYDVLDDFFLKLEENSEKKLFGISDDSYLDFVSDVIGCGKLFFNQVLAQPEVAVEKFAQNDYRECFKYCFPLVCDAEGDALQFSDYGLLNPQFYATQALELIAREKNNFQPDEIPNKYIAEIKNAHTLLLEGLHLVADKKFDQAMAMKTEYRAAFKILIRHDFYRLNSMYAPENLFSDIETFLMPFAPEPAPVKPKE